MNRYLLVSQDNNNSTIYNYYLYSNIYKSDYNADCLLSQVIVAIKNKKNINTNRNYITNMEILNNIIEKNKDNLKNAAKIIIEDILHNNEFYIKLDKKNNIDDYLNLNPSNLNDNKEIIYINSLDELFSVTKSDKSLLFCLNDILIKLELNKEITISNLYYDFDNFYYGVKNIENDHNVKKFNIGYIDEKSKLYNENLIEAYDKNFNTLISFFAECILSKFKFNTNDNIYNEYSKTLEKEICNKLEVIFKNLL